MNIDLACPINPLNRLGNPHLICPEVEKVVSEWRSGVAVSPKLYVFTQNTVLNDLRKIICLRKSEVYVKKRFLMLLKNWWGMAYNVCHAPIHTPTS